MLPVGVPVLCLAMLGVVSLLCYARAMRTSVQRSNVRLDGDGASGGAGSSVGAGGGDGAGGSDGAGGGAPRRGLFDPAQRHVVYFASYCIQALNLPGVGGEVVVSMATGTWRSLYQPRVVGPSMQGGFVWYAISFPFFCAPFWWFAGLGLDTLTGRRSLRWPVLLMGTLLCALFLCIAVMVVIADGTSRHYFGLEWCGFALWVSLMASFPAAWVRLGLVRRVSRQAGVAAG